MQRSLLQVYNEEAFYNLDKDTEFCRRVMEILKDFNPYKCFNPISFSSVHSPTPKFQNTSDVPKLTHRKYI
jgi:hypothetical protein